MKSFSCSSLPRVRQGDPRVEWRGRLPSEEPFDISWGMPTVARGRIYYGWTLLTSLGAISIIAYMIDSGQDPVMAATLAGMVGLASLSGRYVFNALSEHFPPQRLLGISLAILAFGVTLLTLAHTTGGLIAYLVVYGSAFGATGGLAASVRAEHFGRRAFGTISAIQGYPGLGAAALGPVLAGWMYDRSGSYQLTFAVVAALYALSAGAMFATPKPRPSARG